MELKEKGANYLISLVFSIGGALFSVVGAKGGRKYEIEHFT